MGRCFPALEKSGRRGGDRMCGIINYSLSSPHSGTCGACVRPAVRPGRRPGTPPAGGACAAGTPARRAARSSFRTPLASPAPGGASFRTPPPNPRLLAGAVRHAPAPRAFHGKSTYPKPSGRLLMRSPSRSQRIRPRKSGKMLCASPQQIATCSTIKRMSIWSPWYFTAEPVLVKTSCRHRTSGKVGSV